MSEAIAVLEVPAAETTATEIALVDLSSIAYPIWHMSGSQPDPDYTSQQIVARVRALTSNHPKAAICCDSGKSFRNELSPDYKAQRETAPAALFHQIDLAKERLEAEGYPVWAVKGFEADDLIASATKAALDAGDCVLVISGDKDALQLVGDRVRVQSTGASGSIYDAAAVKAKFGVFPAQIVNYLALVGDAADNVKGAKGIGKVRAAELLQKWGTLHGIYQGLKNFGTQFTPAVATALRDFEGRLDEVVKLITLRTDVALPFAELDNDRASKAAPMEGDEMDGVMELRGEVVADKPAPVAAVSGEGAATAPVSAPVVEAKPVNGNGHGNGVPAPAQDVLAPAPVEFERQLEPRSLGQASALSKAMFAAKMFNGYGSEQAVLSTVLAGRELGMQAIAALRAFHVIDGKHALAADAMRGLVLQAKAAKYFRVVERTAERSTFETWRYGDPEPIRLTYTIAEGRAAFKPELPDAEREKKWAASAWGKHPADMLAARASSKLARLVYSDILFGLYAPEELRD